MLNDNDSSWVAQNMVNAINVISGEITEWLRENKMTSFEDVAREKWQRQGYKQAFRDLTKGNLVTRREFLNLPMWKRREILKEQANDPEIFEYYNMPERKEAPMDGHATLEQ